MFAAWHVVVGHDWGLHMMVMLIDVMTGSSGKMHNMNMDLMT